MKGKRQPSTPSSRRLNPVQSFIASHATHNFLVSAAAGTGKTTVLVERVLNLLGLGGNPVGQPVSLDEILVVTFTRKAAGELKERIFSAARAVHAPGLESLSAQLERAWISTIHSFCARVIRDNYLELDIDPTFRIVAEGEENLILRELISQLIERRFGEAERDEELAHRFHVLYRELAKLVREKDLADRLISTYQWLRTLPEGVGWLDRMARCRRALVHADSPAELGEEGRWLEGALVEQVHLYQRHLSAWYRRLRVLFQVHALQVDRRRLDELDRVVRPLTSFRVKDLADFFNFCQLRTSLARQVPSDHWVWKIGTSKRGQVDRIPKELDDLFRAPFTRIRELVYGGNQQTRSWLRELASLIRTDFSDLREEFSDHLLREEEFALLIKDLDRAYSLHKRRLNYLDQSDLLILAHRLFSQNGEVLARYRRRFRYVLVDEFQDIDPLQHELIGLLAEGGGFFAVGDVKQSIYQFRHAEPQIFRQMLEQAEEASPDGSARLKQKATYRVHLTENYRSRREIVAAVNHLFTPLFGLGLSGVFFTPADRLVFGQRRYEELCQREPAYPQSHPVELLVVPAHPDLEPSYLELEARAVARRIDELLKDPFPIWDKERDELRPLARRDIVILMRSVRERAIYFQRALEELGIPAHLTTPGDFFERPEVRDLISLMLAVENPLNEIPLVAALRLPRWDLSPSDLLKLQMNLPERYSFFFCLINALEAAGIDSTPYLEGFAVPDGLRGERRSVFSFSPDQELVRKVRDFLDTLLRWRQAAARLELPELVGMLMREGWLTRLVSAYPQPWAARANLERLRALARSFAQGSGHSLTRFIRYLEDLRLRLETQAMEEVLSTSEAGDTVRIMTIHQAKGLEFPVVILPDLNKSFNQSDLNREVIFDRQLGTAMELVAENGVSYAPMIRSLIRQRNRLRLNQEELRLLYVAMTRAREKLILSLTVDVGASSRSSGYHQHQLANRVERYADFFSDPAGRELTRALGEELLISAQRPSEWLIPPLILGTRAWPLLEKPPEGLGEMELTPLASLWGEEELDWESFKELATQPDDELGKVGGDGWHPQDGWFTLRRVCGDEEESFAVEVRLFRDHLAPQRREPISPALSRLYEVLSRGEVSAGRLAEELEVELSLPELAMRALAKISPTATRYRAVLPAGLKAKYTATELRLLRGDAELEERLAEEGAVVYSMPAVREEELFWRALGGDGGQAELTPAELGNLYHAVMERVELADLTLGMERRVQEIVGPEAPTRLNPGEVAERIAAALADPQIRELFADERFLLLRERAFSLRIPASEIGPVEGFAEVPFVVIVGKFDLLALDREGERAVVVDWKTDGLMGDNPPGEEELTRLYRPQLAVYKLAAKRLLPPGGKVRTLIYSFSLERTIEVEIDPNEVVELLRELVASAQGEPKAE